MYFRGAAIETITLHKNITEIHGAAFWRTNLTTINYNGTKAEWNSINFVDDQGIGAFEECPQITVHCTDGDIIIPATN